MKKNMDIRTKKEIKEKYVKKENMKGSFKSYSFIPK